MGAGKKQQLVKCEFKKKKKKTEKRNWSKFNRSWKKQQQELVKWKLENNTTRIGQNVMGVGINNNQELSNGN